MYYTYTTRSDPYAIVANGPIRDIIVFKWKWGSISIHNPGHTIVPFVALAKSILMKEYIFNERGNALNSFWGYIHIYFNCMYTNTCIYIYIYIYMKLTFSISMSRANQIFSEARWWSRFSFSVRWRKALGNEMWNESIAFISSLCCSLLCWLCQSYITVLEGAFQYVLACLVWVSNSHSSVWN